MNRGGPAVEGRMPSRQMQDKIRTLLALRAAAAGQPAPTVAQNRASFDSRGDLYPLPGDTVVSKADADGVPARWITFPGADAGRVLLYLHGGGYQIGSFHSHGELAARLGRASGRRGLPAGYRLAAGHPFPARIADAVAGLRRVRRAGGPG